MLVLTRRLGEKIIVTTAGGERIVILVADIDRCKVRIGVEADRSVSIFREELLPAARPSGSDSGTQD